MRIDSPSFAALLRSPLKEYRFVVGIVLDVDSIYITSHGDIAGVPGTVIEGALSEPVIVSQRLRPDDARAEIGTATFSLVDVASQFTDEVRERLADGVGMRGKTVRFYFGFAGQAFSELRLIGTQRVAEIIYSNGRYNVECADIQRTMREDIFEPVVTTLAATLTAGDTTIQLTDATRFQMVYHGASYTDAPMSTVGYVRIRNTIYRYTGKTANALTGVVPVFGTTAETIEIDPGVSADRREAVTEYIYLELPGVKLALAILTGNLYSDGFSLPAHWSLGIGSEWITESDFLGIGSDLWNPATDVTPGSGLVLRFEGLKRTDAKTFLEKQVYLALGLFSPIYADGSLGLRRMARIAPDSSHTVVLNNSNSIAVGDLRHAMKSVHNVFRVNWSYNGDRYNRSNDLIDLQSVSVHGRADLYERSFQGFHGSIHTDAVIFGMLGMLRDRYAGPPEEINATVFDSLNGLEVGDIVRGQWEHVRDFAGPAPGANDPGIDRAFEVQSVKCDFRTGVTLELFGSTSPASVEPPTKVATSLPNDFYTSAGTALSAAPGITIVGGVLTGATATLTGNPSLTSSAAIYYHDGDLTIAAGVTLNIAENVQLRIRGFLQINGTINGVGRGLPGVVDDGRALAVTYELQDWYNDRIAAETISGNPGFVGPSRGRDGVYWFNWTGGLSPSKLLATRAAAFTPSVHPVAPVLALQVSGSSLLGLPNDLRGTGGAPGGRAGRDSSPPPLAAQFRGGAGANGGAGLMVICRGLARGANGLVDLSGANSASTTMVSQESTDMYAGAGGAGGPGACYILLDGGALSVPDLGAGFRALTGVVPSAGNALAARGQNGISEANGQYLGPNHAAEPVAGFADPAVVSGMNLSGSALRVQYIPASETPQEDVSARPPPPTNLTATGVVGANAISVSAPPPEQWDVIEIYAAATNDRSGATLVSRARSTTFTHGFSTATGRYYWARTRRAGVVSSFYPASATTGIFAQSIDAGSGAPGESIEVEFSVSAAGPWHGTFAAGDLYMRTRVGSGGAWQGPWRVVGEEGIDGTPGADGNFTVFIFRRSATTPAQPTGNSPAGWSDGPPAHNGNLLWMSRGLKTPAGVLVGTWSTPQILVVDGEDGEPGLPGAQGPGLFTWAGATNVSTTSSSISKTTGVVGYNAGAYSIESYSAGCFFTARAGQTNIAKVIGLNDDPATDSGMTGINFGWLFGADGLCYIVQNGVQGASQGAYTTATVLSAIADGANVRFYKDGVQIPSVEPPFVGRLFLDTSINAVGGSLVDIHFGPNGSRGPTGSTGAAARSIRLSSTAQAFTFAANNATAQPAGQSITFTARRENIATATSWSTTPSGVTLTGSGDSRVLSVSAFGGNAAVTITAASEGFSDSITVVRLAQGAAGADGQPAVVGYLTNESHTLAADPDGVVDAGAYAGAVGLFRVFEGVADRSTAATFAILSAQGCTAQINTADNTPIAGQPRGFYRVTAVSTDQAFTEFRGSYNGVDVVKRFTITRARAGRNGDGQNLLTVDDWVIGSTGSQGSGRWGANGLASENAIVLGGAGTAPAGPLGAIEPLWECRPSGDGQGDGGWDTAPIPIDHTKSYRSTVWVRLNQISGSMYLGCGHNVTATLGGGVANNPYFIGSSLSALRANRWYLVVGVIHGSGYTGGQTGVAGIYDPETGQQLYSGTEYRNLPGAATQAQRAYHFYDSNTSTRQWFARPRFEVINGSEPTLDSLLGFQRTIPWLARGGCQAGARSFFKSGSSPAWDDADVISVVGYSTCHLQFKAGSASTNFMIGLSDAPRASMSYTNINYALYCTASGVLQIYENGTYVGDFGPYSAQTQLGITRSASGNIRYWKDGAIIRGPLASPSPLYYLDSSFYTPGAAALNVAFGPGTEFELMSASDLPANSLTRVFDVYVANSLLSPMVSAPETGLVSQLACTLTGQYQAPGSTTISILAEFWVGNAITRSELSPAVPCISSDSNVPTPIQYTFVKLPNERCVVTGRFSYTGGPPFPSQTKFAFYSANLHVEDILR